MTFKPSASCHNEMKPKEKQGRVSRWVFIMTKWFYQSEHVNRLHLFSKAGGRWTQFYFILISEIWLNTLIDYCPLMLADSAHFTSFKQAICPSVQITTIITQLMKKSNTQRKILSDEIPHFKRQNYLFWRNIVSPVLTPETCSALKRRTFWRVKPKGP